VAFLSFNVQEKLIKLDVVAHQGTTDPKQLKTKQTTTNTPQNVC